jgi:hypothetical protein
MAGDDVSTGRRDFIGGPLDGQEAPGDYPRWYFADGHAYLRGSDERWRYVGVECGNCSSVNSPGDDGREPDACRLCGSPITDHGCRSA